VDWANLAKQWIAQKEAVEVIHHEVPNDTLAHLQAPPPPPPPDPESSQDSTGGLPVHPVQEDENSMDISDGEGEGPAKSGANGENKRNPRTDLPPFLTRQTHERSTLL
jgi:hypothetical protein